LQAKGLLLKHAVVAKSGCKFENTEVPRREMHSESLNTEKTWLTMFGERVIGRSTIYACPVLSLFCKHVFMDADVEAH